MKRIRQVQESWAGTPYMSGQQVKGTAVDCIRYGAGMLDELYGERRELPKNLPLDSSLHAPVEARAAMHRLRSLYPELRQVVGGEVQPMDLIVTGPLHGGPGHLIVVGWEPNTCWEASDPEVSKIGIGLDPRTQHVFKVYRANNRGSWLWPS